MSYTPVHKQRTRERILASARRLFKERGYGGVSVDGVMAEAGLTRGGFYAHFRSKDDLIAAALDEPVLVSFLCKYETGREPPRWTRSVLEEYLGALHRDHPATGCPLAAHGGEIRRAAPGIRAAFTAQADQAAAALSERLPGTADERFREALGILALLVGGVTLARAVDDTQFSDAILAACRDAISDI